MTTKLQSAPETKTPKKYLFNYDWLSINFDGLINEQLFKIQDNNYSLLDKDLQYPLDDILIVRLRETQHYQNIYALYKDGVKYFEIATNVKDTSVITNKQFTQIKIENQLLYNANLRPILLDIFSNLHLEYKGISRLDIALDTDFYLHEKKIFLNKLSKYMINQKIKSNSIFKTIQPSNYNTHLYVHLLNTCMFNFFKIMS